ncbi:MAG: hypothetical protein HOM58_18880 [Rhodospirillaceae bacterium]|nr:hypothetical protein [Rhodospirillaceae bacterium]MBT5459741.1 hypothetical protein [Rhodospirillaceae bacterium]
MTFVLLGPVGFLAPKGLWFLILLFFVLHAGTLRSLTADDVRSLLKQKAVFLAVPCYALFSALWAIDPGDAAKTSLKLLGYVIAAVLIVLIVQKASDREKRSILFWSAIGLMAGQAVVWVDVALGGSLFAFARSDPFIASSYNRGVAITVCMMLPLTVGLLRLSLKPLALALIGTSLVTVFVLESESAKLALVAGVVVYFLVNRYGRLFWPVLVLLAGLFVAMPAIFSVELSDKTICTLCGYKCSAAHRLLIYNYSSQRIFEKPIAGWGMDSARSIPSGKETAFISGCVYGTRTDNRLQVGNWMPLHPHSAALQTWLELGAIGVLLVLGSLARLVRGMARAPSFERNRGLVAGIAMSLFMTFNISFGFWQGWLMFSMVLLCALVALTLRLEPADRSPVSKGA